jgi:hypothetical protein
VSHTTEISSIVFSDIEALRLAVRDLQKSGVRCELREKATPRAFYNNQQGMGLADYVLHLHDSPYDVGFYTDSKVKGYVARTDLFLGHVQKVLGAPAQKGEKEEQAALGRLYQAYAVNAATRQAARQGYSCRRVTKADGTVQLIMNVA